MTDMQNFGQSAVSNSDAAEKCSTSLQSHDQPRSQTTSVKNARLFANLPELVRAAIVEKLHFTAQAPLRLTCKSWRDHLPAHELTHTLCFGSGEGWEEKARKLKLKFPKLKIQIRHGYSSSPKAVEGCMLLLQSPYCDILRLSYRFTSYESAKLSDPEWLEKDRQRRIESVRTLNKLVDVPAAHASLQIKMNASCTHSGPQARELSEAFAKLVPYIADMTISGNISRIVQQPSSFSRLSKLELTLPTAESAGTAQSSDASDAATIQQLQRLILTLPRLSHLGFYANGDSLQPSAILSVLSKLPNLACLKVCTGIMPCKVAFQDLQHVTGLSLGRAVSFDHPPASLHCLHLAYLGLPQKPMLQQLRQMQGHASISAGSLGAEGLTLSPCQQRCCPHNDLVESCEHLHVAQVDEMWKSVQPCVYLCD